MGNICTKYELDKLTYYVCPDTIFVRTKSQTFLIKAKNKNITSLTEIEIDIVQSLITTGQLDRLDDLARYCKRLGLIWVHTESKKWQNTKS